MHLLANIGPAQEVSGGDHAKKNVVRIGIHEIHRTATNLKSPYFSMKFWYSSKTLKYKVRFVRPTAEETIQYLGVHHIRSDIGIGDVLAKAATQVSLDPLEVQGLHGGTGTTVDSWFVADDLGAKGFRESSNWLTKIALEELHNRRREVELVCAIENVLGSEIVGSHPLGKVSDNLGRWCNLDDVPALIDSD